MEGCHHKPQWGGLVLPEPVNRRHSCREGGEQLTESSPPGGGFRVFIRLLSVLDCLVSGREAWRDAVHGVAKDQTRLMDRTTTTAVCGKGGEAEGEAPEDPDVLVYTPSVLLCWPDNLLGPPVVTLAWTAPGCRDVGFLLSLHCPKM